MKNPDCQNKIGNPDLSFDFSLHIFYGYGHFAGFLQCGFPENLTYRVYCLCVINRSSVFCVGMRSFALDDRIRALSITAKEKCTLARDDIQPFGLMIYTALRAAMICQACGLDKKFDKPQLVEFFGLPERILNPASSRLRLLSAHNRLAICNGSS